MPNTYSALLNTQMLIICICSKWLYYSETSVHNHYSASTCTCVTVEHDESKYYTIVSAHFPSAVRVVTLSKPVDFQQQRKRLWNRASTVGRTRCRLWGFVVGLWTCLPLQMLSLFLDCSAHRGDKQTSRVAASSRVRCCQRVSESPFLPK